MLIKTTKAGQKVELIGEKIYLDGKEHAVGIYPLLPHQRDKAKALMPDAAYTAGSILLSKDQGEAAKAALETARRTRWAAEKAALNQAIPGIDILIAASNDHEQYAADFEIMMEDEQNDGVRPPAQPTSNLAALRAQYPRAACYLRAEAYECASHDQKSSAGKRAKALLVAGGEIAEAEKIMTNWLPESAQWN